MVEHDEDTIRRADHIIDIGPSAGKRGGWLVAEGSVADITAAADSQTGRYLLHAMRHPMQARRWVGLPGTAADTLLQQEGAISPDLIASSAEPVKAKGKKVTHKFAASMAAAAAAAAAQQPAVDLPLRWLTVHGAQLHNLQNVTASVPLHRLVAVTGVSGSGKSTLARDVLLTNVQAWVQQRSTKAGRDAMDAGKSPALVGCTGLAGFETIDRVLEVDQTPIGKTPRSCPATYIGFWDTVPKHWPSPGAAKALATCCRWKSTRRWTFSPSCRTSRTRCSS